MRRLDHAMIFVLIAATQHAVRAARAARHARHGHPRVVWAGALGGLVLQLAWTDHPKWVSSLIGVRVRLPRPVRGDRRIAPGGARVAGAAAVAQQVDVQLELLAGRGEREHLVVELLERGAGAQQAAGASRRARRACRPAPRAGRSEQQHAGGRLAADAGQRAERSRDLLGGASAIQSRLSGSPIARRICWIRTDLTFEMPPGRIASSTSCAGASRTASQLAKRSRKAQEGDVAVAVVGALREHGEDQLVDRAAVRRRGGMP
jgi:hypothetical protein